MKKPKPTTGQVAVLDAEKPNARQVIVEWIGKRLARVKLTEEDSGKMVELKRLTV